jgi:hypothetical protein
LNFAFMFNRRFDPAKIYEANHSRYRPVNMESECPSKGSTKA